MKRHATRAAGLTALLGTLLAAAPPAAAQALPSTPELQQMLSSPSLNTLTGSTTHPPDLSPG